MPSSSYDRYGLTSNPFRDLSSESLDDIEVYHVNLDVDRLLETVRDEVFSKENRAFIGLVGLHGAGKTERLLVTQAEAEEHKAFCVYFDITTKTTWVTRGLAEAFRKEAGLGGFAQIFSAPRWFRDLGTLEKLKDKNYDALKAGRILAAALNANVPSFLLLNDIHNLSNSQEFGLFSKALQELVDAIQPGVMVMFGSFPSFMLQLATHQAALVSRINRTILLPRLTAEEAALLIAKKLLAKRLVEGLDPLYPFDQEAVFKVNQYAYGNPRRLIELADACMEFAVAHRTYRIDAEVVRSAMIERHVGDLKTEVDTRADSWQEDAPAGPTNPAPAAKSSPSITPGTPSAVSPAPPASGPKALSGVSDARVSVRTSLRD